MATPNAVDLTPFGFTPTESRVYDALLGLGPSSGYAVAGALGIARANAYQAIASLVAKGVVATLPGQPVRVRAVPPDGLMALLVARQGQRLELLDKQLQRRGMLGDAGERVVIGNQRAMEELATRVIVRDQAPLEAVGPQSFFTATGPAWRKRAADGRTSQVWSIADSAAPAEAERAEVPAQALIDLFGSPVVLLAGDSNALAVALVPGDIRGWWAQDKLSIGIVRGAIATATIR